VCHQTVSLVARYLEERGLPTLCMASALDIIQAGNPPRAVFVDYPLGHTAGKPFDPDDQRLIVRAALRAFASIQKPGDMVHLESRWGDDDAWKASAADASAGDQRSPRNTEPQYQTEEDRALAEADRRA
jgi:D-proline reductase (dithiol) PrdB